MCVCLSLYVYLCVWVCVCVYVSVCVYLCVCLCVCVEVPHHLLSHNTQTREKSHSGSSGLSPPAPFPLE